jgi:hypothetical protein
MPGSGFSVETTALGTASQAFSGTVPAMAQSVQAVAGSLAVTTGNPALDAMISRLAGQVTSSLAGCGQAMQADSTGLSLNAAMYAASDVASVPQITLGPGQ